MSNPTQQDFINLSNALASVGKSVADLQSNFPAAAALLAQHDPTGNINNNPYLQYYQDIWYTAHPASNAPSGYLGPSTPDSMIISPLGQPTTINGLPNVGTQQLTLKDSNGHYPNIGDRVYYNNKLLYYAGPNTGYLPLDQPGLSTATSINGDTLANYPFGQALHGTYNPVNTGQTMPTVNNPYVPTPDTVGLQSAINNLTQSNSGLSQKILDLIQTQSNTQTPANTGLSQGILDSFVGDITLHQNLINDLQSQLNAARQQLANPITPANSGLSQAIIDSFQKPLTELTQSNTGLSNAIVDSVNKTLQQNQANSTQSAADIVDKLQVLANNVIEAVKSTVSNISLLPDGLIKDIVTGINAFATDETNQITSALKDWLSIDGKAFKSVIGSSVDGINDTLNKQGATLDKLLKGQFNTMDEFYAELKRDSANSQTLSDIQNIFTVGFGLFTFLKARLSTEEIVLNQLMLAQDTPNVNDIGTLVTAYFRGAISYDLLKKDIAKLGLDETRLVEILNARRLIMSIGDADTALHKGLIDSSDYNKILSSYGLDDTEIQTIYEAHKLIPSPTDITRLGDKHIFSTDIPQIFGQYSEIDSGLIDAMKLWGIDEDWTRKLWAAHWSLPGVEQIFDMHHRGIISTDERDVFFRLTDTLPFFRDKLVELNYNLVTRVDIRRLHQLGIYDRNKVYQAYLKEGYSPNDANDLTDFTVIHDNLADSPAKVKIRTLTESLVIKALKEGIITHEQAVSRLINLGYNNEDARLVIEVQTQLDNSDILLDKTRHYHEKAVDLLINSYAKGTLGRDDTLQQLVSIGVDSGQAQAELYYAEIERITYIKSKIIDSVGKAYKSGHINKQTASNLMLGDGIGMSEILLLFEGWDIDIRVRSKELTLAQLNSLLGAGIIQPIDYETELKNMGYSDLHIGWLMAEVTG